MTTLPASTTVLSPTVIPGISWSDVCRDLPSEIETVVCGHTHMPFARLVHGRMVVGPALLSGTV